MLITCPECSLQVSDKAAACMHCGCPLTPISSTEGIVTVYGLSQMNLVGGTLKVFANGQPVGSVKRNHTLTFTIVEDTEITVKCGINPSKGAITAQAGKETKIKYDFNRITGCLVPQIVDQVINRSPL